MDPHESSTSPLLSPEIKVTAEEATAVLKRLAERRHERRHLRIVLIPLFVGLLSAVVGGLYAGPRHPQLHTPGLRKRANCEPDNVQKESQQAAAGIPRTRMTTSSATTTTAVTTTDEDGGFRVFTSEWLVEVVITSTLPPAPVPTSSPPAETPKEQPKQEPAPTPTSSTPPEITVGQLFPRTKCGEGVDCCGEVRCTAAFSTGGFFPDQCTKPAVEQTSCLYTCSDPAFTVTGNTACLPTSTTSSTTSSTSASSSSSSSNSGNDNDNAPAAATPTGTITCEAEETCGAIEGLKAGSEKCQEGKCAYTCGEGACQPKEGEVLGACIPTGQPITASCAFCSSSSTWNAQAAICTPTAPAGRYKRW